MKVCSTCGEEKEHGEFSKDKNKKDDLQSQCKSCAKEYRELNKEALAIRQAEYQGLNKEAVATYQAKYREDNKEALANKSANYRELNKEVLMAKKAEYQKTPKGKAGRKNAAHKRRAITKEGSVTTEQLEILATTTNCFYCNCVVTDDNRHIDHYIPLSKGGLHDIDNLVIACSTCNLKKGAKMPGVFIATLTDADQERLTITKRVIKNDTANDREFIQYNLHKTKTRVTSEF